MGQFLDGERLGDVNNKYFSCYRPVSKQCTRCASVFAVNYRPAIIHQFSSVLGYLDLDGSVTWEAVE